MSRKNILFICDPWETFQHNEETTFYLACAAQELGFQCYSATPDQIYFYDGHLFVHEPSFISLGAIRCQKIQSSSVKLTSYHSVHWRVDPPVTLFTMRLWSLLACAGKKIKFVNAPQSLLKWNEKFSALSYPQWALPTLITQDARIRVSLAKDLAGQHVNVIFKPSGDAASRGVALVKTELTGRAGDSTDPWPVLQRFDPKIMKGEARAFVLNGSVVASLIKLPVPQEPIMRWGDLQRLPKVTPAPLTPAQKKMSQKIARDLKAEGVHFATVDFIGARLLEINVTSPGLVHALKESQRESLCIEYWKAI